MVVRVRHTETLAAGAIPIACAFAARGPDSANLPLPLRRLRRLALRDTHSSSGRRLAAARIASVARREQLFVMRNILPYCGGSPARPNWGL